MEFHCRNRIGFSQFEGNIGLKEPLPAFDIEVGENGRLKREIDCGQFDFGGCLFGFAIGTGRTLTTHHFQRKQSG